MYVEYCSLLRRCDAYHMTPSNPPIYGRRPSDSVWIVPGTIDPMED